MNYGEIKKVDIANGPGVRVSLFVSGCTHHCKGCFNAVTWDFDYGVLFDENAMRMVIDAMKPNHIAGLTLLGGEPMEPSNQEGLLPFVKEIKALYPDKNIWCYTGYLFDQDLLNPSRARTDITDEFLKYIDIIVDGQFQEELKDITLRFKGSSNQRVIDVQESLRTGTVVLSSYNEKREQTI